MSVFPTRHQTERTTTDSIRAADAILASGVQLLTFVWYDSVPTTSRCAPRIISPDSSECLVTLPHWLHQQRPLAPVHLRGVLPVYDVDPPNVVPRERSFVKRQCRIYSVADVAYATGPALLGAPRFYLDFLQE